MAPSGRAEAAFRTMPAVDVAETDKAYEITAELPGLDEKNIEVKLANGVHQRREAGGQRGERERLLQTRAQLRLVRAQLSGTRGHRYRQNRGQL
jgi:HSP20 family molecular chaperone IbpA